MFRQHGGRGWDSCRPCGRPADVTSSGAPADRPDTHPEPAAIRRPRKPKAS